MTSYCPSDLWFRYHVAIFVHRTGILSLAFALLSAMCNKLPNFAGEVLLERPLCELPGVLFVTTQRRMILALFAIHCLRVGGLTF